MRKIASTVVLACACTTGGTTDAAKRCDNWAKAMAIQEVAIAQGEAYCPAIADEKRRRACEVSVTATKSALEAQKVVYDAECAGG